jgi:hypothetical protein
MMSSFRTTAAHSSRVKKSKPLNIRRSVSASPFSSFPRQKPIQRSKSKAEAQEEEDDEFGDRLDDIGLARILAKDLTLRDVAQAIQCIKGRMFSSIPEQRSGMNSTRIAEVLNFRKALPPIVTVAHVQALLNAPTTVEREIAELCNGGAIRKIVVPGRGGMGEALVLVKDLEESIRRSTGLEDGVKESYISLLRELPTALQIPRGRLSQETGKQLTHAGFLTSSMPTWTSADVFSTPGDGSRGTLTSLTSIAKAAAGSLAPVGSEGAVHAAGGSGGGFKSSSGLGDFNVALPNIGSYLKLLTNARAHLVALLSRSKFREAPEELLRERWNGGIAGDYTASEAKRVRGEFAGILPGRTRKWKQFYGITFEWILEECVGAGMVEVFETRSVGRGVRAI